MPRIMYTDLSTETVYALYTASDLTYRILNYSGTFLFCSKYYLKKHEMNVEKNYSSGSV